ncbi:hypothetical protein [Rufibacter sp. LB8]|uniref:hypothetical protein n=1 Tax=Rufibacter sp. LB8 TaxID=2777781 RepID=UPI00178C5170|nr:hypothetical protein [Rufibacter sp. LB8]
MKTYALQIEGLKEVFTQIQQSQQDGDLDPQLFHTALVNAKLFLHEISMQCKAKHLKPVETTATKLDVLRKEIQSPLAPETVPAFLDILATFLENTQIDTKAPQEDDAAYTV